MHRSQIVLCVLEVIFRGDPVAASGFGLRQRQIAVIVSARILRRLGLGEVEFRWFGVLVWSSRHCDGVHFSVRQRLRCCSISRDGGHSTPWVIGRTSQSRATFVREDCWMQSTGALRQGDRTSMAPASMLLREMNSAPEDRNPPAENVPRRLPNMGKRTKIFKLPRASRELGAAYEQGKLALPPAACPGPARLLGSSGPTSGSFCLRRLAGRG